MNFQTLSTDSVPSRKGPRRPLAGEAKLRSSKASGKGGREDLDLPLKLQVANALSTSGYYCKLSVSLSATSGTRLADVTDVDVLAIRHDLTFRPTIIAASCKSGEARSLSPAREIFHLRGVMDYLVATDGAVLFANKSVPLHHRDLGRQLNILVLAQTEIAEWLKSLVNGLPLSNYFESKRYSDYVDCMSHPAFENAANYLESDYWFYRDFRNLQNVIGHYKKIAAQLDGSAPWHSIVAFQTAIHLCISILDLCRYIRFAGPVALEESTAAYLFGGTISFKARRDLYSKVQQLLSATGILSASGPTLPALEPVYTPALAELVVRLIGRPQAAVRIPQVLQDESWRLFGASGLIVSDDSNTLVAQKLAQDLLNFLKNASGSGWIPKL